MDDEMNATPQTGPATGDAGARPVQKWYFAANLNALRHAFDQIEVAVKSAKSKTTLRPYCLIDDHEDLSEVASRLNWLETSGVSLIRHRAEFFDVVRQHFGPKVDAFSGHWLRSDIPILETAEEVVLYTDIDIMFRRDIDFSRARPPFLACSPEHRQDDFSYFNSGVMIMNIPALRDSRAMLMQVVKDRLDSMPPYDDQATFNVAYRDTWTRLPNLCNWKPYWGFNADAAIVHFHGPKPGMVRRMFGGEVDIYPPEYGEIFHRNPEGYAKYMAEFDEFLGTEVS